MGKENFMSTIYSNPIVKAWCDNYDDRVAFVVFLQEMYGAAGLQKLIDALKGEYKEKGTIS